MRKTLFLAGFLLLPWLPAAAQTPSQAQASAIRSACRNDYMSYCANVPTGGQASLQCLQQHQASVSSGCQQALAGLGGGAPAAAPPPGGMAPAGPPLSPRQEGAVVRAYCRYDFRRFCYGTPPGGGRILACLRANGPSLSPGCRSALMSLRGPR